MEAEVSEIRVGLGFCTSAGEWRGRLAGDCWSFCLLLARLGAGTLGNYSNSELNCYCISSKREFFERLLLYWYQSILDY